MKNIYSSLILFKCLYPCILPDCKSLKYFQIMCFILVILEKKLFPTSKYFTSFRFFTLLLLICLLFEEPRNFSDVQQCFALFHTVVDSCFFFLLISKKNFGHNLYLKISKKLSLFPFA